MEFLFVSVSREEKKSEGKINPVQSWGKSQKL
jgi:hypothetical protein